MSWDKKYSDDRLKARLISAIDSYIPNLKIIKIIERYIKNGDYILEVGCGTGRLINCLAKRNKIFAFGVDMSVKSIEISRDLSSSIETKCNLVRCDIKKLPFKDGSFSVVFADSVIEHVKNYEDAISEIVRVTKTGGYVIITVPNRLRPDGWDLYKYLKKPEYLQLSFYPKELKQLLHKMAEIETMFGDGIVLIRNFKILMEYLNRKRVTKKYDNKIMYMHKTRVNASYILKIKRFLFNIADRILPYWLHVNIGIVGRKI